MHKKLRLPAFTKEAKTQFGSSHYLHTYLHELTRYKTLAQVVYIRHAGLVLTMFPQGTHPCLPLLEKKLGPGERVQ